MTWVDTAKQVEADVARLRGAAKKSVVEASATRRVLATHTETFSIPWGQFAMLEQTWVNGAEDVHIQHITLSGGYFDSGSGGTLYAYDYFFDFMWNFRVGRTAAFYASPANDTSFLSRRGLGVMDRNNYLSFSRPYCLPAGEALTTRIKPVFFPNAALFISDYWLHLTYVGWRTGVRA